MIIVTGGAGFIGANIVKRLNEKGITNILVVDDFSNVEKISNLSDCIIADYMDKDFFRYALNHANLLPKIDIVFHQGACSDTMATDGKYVLDNNFQYSKELLAYCQNHNIPLVYASSASVYGGNTNFEEKPEFELPLNAYAYSKLLFDQYVRHKTKHFTSAVIGLRYFNVYGYREQHKGRMASVAYHFFNQYQKTNKVKLFKGTSGYKNGMQLRDFVFIEDVVDVNLYFYENPITGIYNLGTGETQSFNDVAYQVVNYCRQQQSKDSSSLKSMINNKEIEYVAFPKALKGKYQNYTCANVQNLRAAGYRQEFQLLDVAVPKYLDWLSKDNGISAEDKSS